LAIAFGEWLTVTSKPQHLVFFFQILLYDSDFYFYPANCEFEMAPDLTYSSTSSSPVVLKILIDLDEYHRCLGQEKKQETSQRKVLIDFYEYQRLLNNIEHLD